jgi:hypothetical protein
MLICGIPPYLLISMEPWTIKSAGDVLTPEEGELYRRGWENFPRKYEYSPPHIVQDGRPVISVIYRFENKHVFRAHVFGKALKDIDPYGIADEHLAPYWEIQHFMKVSEQMHIGSLKMEAGNTAYKMKSVVFSYHMEFRRPLYFRENASVELVREERSSRRHIDHLKFIKEKDGTETACIMAKTLCIPRSYAATMESIKGGGSSIEKLVRQIKRQGVNLGKLRAPRKSMLSSEAALIKNVLEGRLPESELHDFFSFWDDPSL